jgi:hypothetical protein
MTQTTPIVDVDTTIDDIHRTRQRLAEKFGGDVNAILEDARQRQAASGHPIWQGTAGDGAMDRDGNPQVD